MRAVTLSIFFAASGFASSLYADEFRSDDLEFFETNVRPVLVERCFECHSAETVKAKAGLHLDSRSSVLLGGERGPAAVPGDAERSRLVEAIRYENVDLQMPPKFDFRTYAACRTACSRVLTTFLLPVP